MKTEITLQILLEMAMVWLLLNIISNNQMSVDVKQAFLAFQIVIVFCNSLLLAIKIIKYKISSQG